MSPVMNTKGYFIGTLLNVFLTVAYLLRRTIAILRTLTSKLGYVRVTRAVFSNVNRVTILAKRRRRVILFLLMLRRVSRLTQQRLTIQTRRGRGAEPARL